MYATQVGKATDLYHIGCHVNKAKALKLLLYSFVVNFVRRECPSQMYGWPGTTMSAVCMGIPGLRHWDGASTCIYQGTQQMPWSL